MRFIIFSICLTFAGDVLAEAKETALEKVQIAQAKATTSTTMKKAAGIKKAAQQDKAVKVPETTDKVSPDSEEMEMEEKVTLSPWSAEVYAWTEAGVTGSTPFTDWYLRLKYKLNDKWTLAFTTDLQTQWEDKLNFDFFDPHFMLSSSNLGALPWGLKQKGYVRAYIPISEASRESDHIGMLRIAYTLTKPLGKLSLSYYAEPRFYFQSRSYSLEKDKVSGLEKPDTLENRTGHSAIRYRHYLKGEYPLSDTVSIYSLVGLWHRWDHNTSSEEGRYSRKIDTITETALTYSGIKNVFVGAGITQLGPSLENKGFAYLRENEGGTSPAVFLETAYSFTF